jgi:hypothetical protein
MLEVLFDSREPSPSELPEIESSIASQRGFLGRDLWDLPSFFVHDGVQRQSFFFVLSIFFGIKERTKGREIKLRS